MTRSMLFLTAFATAIAFTPDTKTLAQAPTPISLTFETSGDIAFDAWRDAFSRRAVEAGRNPETVRQVLSGLVPEARIIEQDQHQAEFVRPVWDYINRSVSPQRISRGQALRAEHADLFSKIERRFGVDSDVIAAIWAVETDFGTFPLPHYAPQAIATLAYEGRRRAQFETYLLALLEMVEKGYAGPQQLRSSWAGALGQPQFMPDIYLSTAVDWDGDGLRDIWTNTGDALASIANFLSARGWRPSEPVYDEILLPRDFDFSLADGTPRPVSQWVQLGARSASGFTYTAPVMAMQAELFLPAGAEGPALLLFPNFGVIRTYNPSDRYALSVSLLARGFEGGSGLAATWPVSLGSLQRDQLLELQATLNKLGYQSGTPDGMFGSNTRRAVRQFQQANGIPADGYPSLVLFETVRSKAVALDRAAAQHAAQPLNQRQTVELQRSLIRLGKLRGSADGDVGPATRRAIESFERSLGLEPMGRATTFVLTEAKKAVSALPPPQKARKKRRRR